MEHDRARSEPPIIAGCPRLIWRGLAATQVNAGRGLLGRLLVVLVLVVAALRGVLAVVTQLGQLFIEGLDGGFLLAKDFLYQLVAMGFERLLLCEEFIDRIVGHVDYDPTAGLPAAGAWTRRRELLARRAISVSRGLELSEQQPEGV